MSINESTAGGHQLLTTLATFQNGDSLTDFKIICRKQSWDVHRVVLALQSPVLRRLCQDQVNDDGSNLSLDLSSHHTDIVDRFVKYLYKMTYPYAEVVDELTKNITSAKFELQMYLLAERYEMAHLKELALERFKWDVKRWTRDAIFEGLKPFGELIQLINQRDDVSAEFRYLVTCKIVTTRVLAESPTVAARVAKLMAACPEFALEMLQRTAKGPNCRKEDYPCFDYEANMESTKCESCKQTTAQRLGEFGRSCSTCD